jgi:two-component system sensor histidine kinase/response regulator
MSNARILVVDDQPINVQLLKRKLERGGLEVSTANNGLEALEQVKAHKPDLILLDLMMPDMDGIEVCQRLQASSDTRSIPVIFVTARTTKESKLEGLAVGAVDYITKPIDLDETVARVRPSCGSRPSTARTWNCSAASRSPGARPPSAPSPRASPTT